MCFNSKKIAVICRKENFMKEQTSNFIKLSKEKSKRYINALHYLPWILAGVLYFLFFVWAIVDPCVFSYEGLYDSEYGIMELSSGFLCWFIWVAIGVVVAVITFFATRFFTAKQLLKIYYLQKIANDNDTVFGCENQCETVSQQ